MNLFFILGGLWHCTRQSSFSPPSQSAHRRSRCHSSFCHPRCLPLPLTPSVTSASPVLMTSSFLLLLRLTFRWPSLCMLGGVRWRFSFDVGPTKSAAMILGPLRGLPDCCVHLGGVPLPLVHLGVVLFSTLSWRPHVDFLCSHWDRLFHQGSASPSLLPFSSPMSSRVPFGLEFRPSAIQPRTLSLVPSSSWVAQCFSCRSSSLGAWALRLALGRAFCLFGCLCAMDHSSSRPRPCQCLQGTWSHWCASALRSLSVPHPGLGSPPTAVRRWLSREAIPRLDRDLRLRLAAMAELHGVRVDVSSDNFFLARENPVYSFNLPPSAVRLWGLVRWGHDLSSTGRSSRHRLGPSSCPFCNDVDGSLVQHLAAWAQSCGVSPSDVPAFARRVGCSTPSTSRTRRRQLGPTFALSGSSANGFNHLSW